MKTFHVYGIGNALLDIDFEVSEETLQKFNIDKGVMTLIDEDKHHKLMHELTGIEHLKACGGSAANTLFTMQQMGSKTFYSCKIGADDAGDFFYNTLIKQGIETNAHKNQRDGKTGKCIVLVTPDADRTMNTFLGATLKFSRNEVSEDALKNANYLYIEGYLVAQETGREAAIYARQLARQHNIKTAITLSDPNMVTHFKSGLCEIIDGTVDLLLCNEQEALLFTDSQNLAEAKSKLQQFANAFVITMGEKGSFIYTGSSSQMIAPYTAKVVDTVGAGDVFAGVLLHCLNDRYDFAFAADIANYAAAKVVSKFGPRLNNDEINDVLMKLENKNLILKVEPIPAIA